MKKITLVLCALSVILCSCRGLHIGPKGEGEYVYGESLVPLNESDMSDTKKRGVYAAQKNAVEQVAGVFISSSTVVDQAGVVENKILSKTQGFIRRYYVTDDYKKGEFYYTRIRALVLVSDINAVIRENEDATDRKTTVMVASREVADENISLRQDCRQAVYQALKSSPYNLLGGDNLSENNIEDPSALIEKARYEGARFLVVADVGASQIENLGGGFVAPFRPYRARANLRVYSTKNSTVVAQASAQQSGLDATPEIAAQKAISAACETAAKDIIEPLKSAVNSSVKYTFTVQNVNSIDRLKDLQDILKDLREVEDFNLVKYNNSAAVFEIMANIKNPEELTAKILRHHSGQFTVMNTSPGVVVLQFL